MFFPEGRIRVHLYGQPCDMRKSFDGLSALVRNALGLFALDGRGVTFRWKDYRERGRTRYKTMTVATDEFMRRFLLHVLPPGFHRIRHYGLLANANRQRDIATARELLHQPAPKPPTDLGDGSADHGCPRPTFVCRHCGAPMLVIETFARAQHIRGPPGSSAAP
jgi:Putative transposase/IS66 Orf2 like protein